MRQIREGEVPRDGGTAVQEDPDRPVFRGNGPDDYVCVECGNVLAVVDARGADDEEGARPLRAVLDRQRLGDRRLRGRTLTRLASASERRAVAAIRGGAVAVDRRDPNQRRVAHRRGREVAQRVAVGPLALDAAEAEALGGQAASEAVGPSRTRRGTAPCARRGRTRAPRRRGRARARRAGTT